jgi:hypothetical protein
MLADYIPRRQAVVLALFLLTLLPFAGSGVVASPSHQTPAPTPPVASKPKLLTDPVPDPKQSGVLYFPQTGHTLRGPFLEYWNRYGGLAQFGYPLTEEFVEEIESDHKLYRVQYFERNRFEHHPENAGTPYEVLLGALGRDFHAADPPAPTLPEATYFPETGHNLGGVFRTYWHSHGGLFVHGYPITEPQMERSTDGKEYLVQWFERSRFEHHPENAGTPYEVLLGLLGTQLAQKKGYPYGWYPLYGHATDYSWFAGYFKADTVAGCRECGCATIRYVSPNNTTYVDAGQVWPYVPAWPLRKILDVEGLEPSVEPQTFVLVLGQLDDLNSITRGKPLVSCLSPKFQLTSIHLNPIR